MFFFHLFRRKLTDDASKISMDQSFHYESPCSTEEVNFHAVKYIHLSGGTLKVVSEKSFWQVVCKKGESVNIGNIQHKVCNPKQAPHMYCFTKTKTRYNEDLLVNVFFKANNAADWTLKQTNKEYSMNIEYGVGCDCGWQLHQ